MPNLHRSNQLLHAVEIKYCIIDSILWVNPVPSSNYTGYDQSCYGQLNPIAVVHHKVRI